MAKVAINGMGRIGRAVFKIVMDAPELELVAVNDLVPADNLAYLLKFDSVYGRYHRQVGAEGESLVVEGTSYPVLNEKNPAQLPWTDLGVDVVFECTGVFDKQEDLEKHIQAGAKYAILSAPTKSAGLDTVVHGVNRPGEGAKTFSCASCTTNCITPVMEIMNRRLGVKKALMTTVHAYTISQSIVDAFQKNKRRGRAGAVNFVPTSTGAAVATTKALPDLAGRFDGVAIRAPIPSGSLADIVFLADRPTSVEEINEIFAEEARSDRYRGVLGVADDEIVSADIIADPRASIVDPSMTQVVDGDLVKVMTWYDNEWGYANQMVREAVRLTG